jgi:hypothetical protein
LTHGGFSKRNEPTGTALVPHSVQDTAGETTATTHDEKDDDQEDERKDSEHRIHAGERVGNNCYARYQLKQC